MAYEGSDPKNPPRPLPETTKSEDGLVVIGKDDLVQREKRRIGDYAAYLTQEVHKNEYPIKGDSVPIKLSTPSGNPAPISDTNQGAVKTYMDTFAEGSSQVARSNFETLSDSGMLNTDTTFHIKKGKSDAPFKTGTELFREVDELRGEAEIPRRVDAALLANNRFNSENKTYVGGQKEGEGNTLGSLIVQPSLGSHLPQKFPKTVDGGQFVSIPISKLKNFGLVTMLEASGEINVPANLSNPDEIMISSGGGLVPGLARLGQKVPTTRFDGVKILNAVEPTYNKSLRNDEPSGIAISSYGNPNNPLVPFNGLLAASSISAAAVLSLSVVAMIKTLYVTVNGLDAASRQVTGNGFMLTAPRQPSEDRRLRLGSYYGRQDDTSTFRPFRNDISLDLVVTKYSYFECVNRGIDVFFDAENLSTGATALSATTSVLQNHNYYNVILRNLIRQTTDLFTGTFETATGQKSAFSVDPNLGSGSPISDTVTNVAAYIKLLNESKLLKFMNVLALIGETSFLSEDTGNSPVDDIVDVSTDENGKAIPKLGVLHMKSRLSDSFGNKLAWGTSTSKSMYLLPAQVKMAATRFDGDDSRFGAMASDRGFKTIDGNRISQEDVKKIEDYLEADYMPFYFHDLRTNEVISFKAFLDSVADSYNVDYTESEGYGRIGKVLNYKNTQRSINLAFSILATNPDDFDEMWYKVNKLITLLYPQYTQGRILQFGEDSFVQPFSQIPAASPLIRLRLGDIFKSNYNKFDLARIFGLGSSEFFLEGTTLREERISANREREEEARNSIVERMTRGEWQVGELAVLIPNYTPGARRGPAPRQTTYQRQPTGNAPEGARTRAQREQQADLNTINSLSVRIMQTEGVQMPRGGGAGIAVRVVNPVGTEQQGTFIVPISSLAINSDEVTRLAHEQVGSTSTEVEQSSRQQDRDAILDFFAADGESPNPVFKSFETVRGRGLAGFIKSFAMDIDSSIQWETVGLNNRAPKILKVNIVFEPIHDLPPGLDHNGYNNAPVYNVGSWLKRSTRDGSSSELNTREVQYSEATKVTTNRNGTRGSS